MRQNGMRKPRYGNSVFINCPFDAAYKAVFDAIVFAIADCGFHPQCALQHQDSEVLRLDKICHLVGECRFGIHDISRTELDTNGLPRFNMPLELGLFLGARRYGAKHHRAKHCLILDKTRHRYQKFVSDIAGLDIKAHSNSPRRAVLAIRNWLRQRSGRHSTPGGEAIWKRYRTFQSQLPAMCKQAKLKPGALHYIDYLYLATAWLEENTEP